MDSMHLRAARMPRLADYGAHRWSHTFPQTPCNVEWHDSQRGRALIGAVHAGQQWFGMQLGMDSKADEAASQLVVTGSLPVSHAMIAGWQPVATNAVLELPLPPSQAVTLTSMFKSAGFWQYASVLGFLGMTFATPYSVSDWLVQNSVVFVGIAVLLWLWRSGTSPTPLLSWMLAVHAFILIYGAWHTYSRAPVGQLMANLFDWDRNHYDRLAHFAQGFFPAVAIREVLWRGGAMENSRRWWREFFVFSIAMASAGLFELLEFAAAVTIGNGSPAYLGSQGDVWDAQWDMFWCAVGALISIALFARRHAVELAQLCTPDALCGRFAFDGHVESSSA